MKSKRHTPEQIIRKLRMGEQLVAEGHDVTRVVRQLEISEATWHRWRGQYGGIKANDVKRLKELEGENRQSRTLLQTRMVGVMANPSGKSRRTESDEPSHTRGGRVPRTRRSEGGKAGTVRNKEGKLSLKRPAQPMGPDRANQVGAWVSRDQVSFPPGSGEQIRERLAAAPEAASHTPERYTND